MRWRTAGRRTISWLASLALCAGGFGIVAPAVAEPEEETPVYMDTSYTFAERAADLVSRMTLEEKASQLGNQAAAIPRLGVSAYDYWSEALHGVARSGEATSFPTGYGIAQSWNRDLVQDIMEATSDEARAYNNEEGKGLSYWSPTINMSRDPRWGRTEETYGEDPFLTTEIGSSFVKGLEGADDDTPYLKAIATIKHYAANNSEFNRHDGSSNMDDRTLREYYTRAFKGVVQNTGVHSAMTSYNRINEIPAAANTYTIETLLRRTFGFNGYVTSDCSAINDVYQNHKWQPSGWNHSVDQAETTALCIMAGTDIECGGVYKANAVAAVQRGIINLDGVPFTEDAIDVALVRVFTARMETGEFDPAEMVPYRSEEYSWDNQISADDHTALALQAAEEGVALLKNEPAEGEQEALLPLDASEIDNLVIVGENELVNNVILGDYSGTPNEANESTPREGITQVLQSLNPDAKVSYIGSPVSGANYFCNFRNFELKDAEGTTTATLTPADADAYSNCTLESGGNFGYAYDNLWVRYDDVALDGVTQITVQSSGSANEATHGTFEVHLDSRTGPVIGTIISQPTGGWSDYRTYTGEITSPQTGIHTLYIVGDSGQEFTPFSEADQNTIRNADAVVAYVGTRQSDSAEERDRSTIALPRMQSDIVNAVLDLNPRTAVYVSSVGQVDIEDFREEASSILWCTYNGQAQGVAAGNLLFGQANPSGKLTFTWYADESELPDIGDYNIYPTETSMGRTYQYFTGKVSYPFGHGLSYTNFEYSNLRVDGGSSATYQMGDVDGDGQIEAADALLALQAATEKLTLDAGQKLRADVDGTEGLSANDALQILQAATHKITLPTVEGEASAVTPDDTVTVSVDVKNTGSVEGAEVVQAYVVSPKAADATRPDKQLKGFEKITLAPGESRTVTIELPVSDWYFWEEEAGESVYDQWDDVTGHNVYDQGDWTIQIGSSSGDIRGTETVTLSGDLTPHLQTVTAIPSGHTLDLSDGTITTDLSVCLNDDSFIELEDATIEYTSSNPQVATVDADGTVHSVAPGVATITAKVTLNGESMESSFPVAVKNELSLNMITVNGTELPDFRPTTYSYTYLLPEGEDTAQVAVPSYGEGIEVQIEQAASIPGTATVTATAGDLTVSYSIYIRKYHEPVSTDFTTVDELPADWRVYDNGADMYENPDNWKLTDQGLVITTEAGDVYQGHNDSKNIFIQDADGDWVADVKLTRSGAFNGGYQQCGVLVFQDEDNCLKISGESGNRIKVVREIGQRTTEMQQENGGIVYSGLTYYFRIAKNGDTYSFFYSTDDGATYTHITTFDAQLSNVKLALTAVNSFNGTPNPIDVAFEYVKVTSMDECTCEIEEVTFDDATVELQDAVAGYPLTAQATVGGDCPVPGHDTANATFTFALKENGENTAGAAISGDNLLTAMSEGVVDVTATAKLLNGKTATKDARLTIQNSDPNFVGWVIKDETSANETHTMTVSRTLTTPLDLTKYEGRTLYLEYDTKVRTTHADPAPANDDWVKYIVNGWVKINGVQIAELGYNSTPPSYTKNDTWTTFKVEIPETVTSGGIINTVEFLTYNDTGTKYPSDPAYEDNGITWSNDKGAIMSVQNVRITAEPQA